MVAMTTATPTSATRATTLGELKASGYRARSVKDEVRENLIIKLRNQTPIFPGVVGYEETVTPQVVNALLARQNFILLGLRGQAKSRILRAITELLDPEIPVIAGSELHDDPLRPISADGKRIVAEHGDATPILWRPRTARYVEKLATPDVTVADLIGDVDPIKAARLGKTLGDELTVHYGLLPRANRGVFAVNELADLSPKVQVSLFNIMQEGDVQIKGYPLRLELDVLLVFSANPEDYTARGKIVTPLKDRIGSEIRTHYPATVEQGMSITRQEAWLGEDGERAFIPGFISELVEEIAFQAREDPRVDKQSGVSQRLPISLIELVASNAERRALVAGDEPVARPADLYASLSAITGKLELEYEGEMKGADKIAQELIRRAAGVVFARRLPKAETGELEKWFDQGQTLALPLNGSLRNTIRDARQVPRLLPLARELAVGEGDAQMLSAIEFVLEGLVGRKKISRSEEHNAYAAAEPEETRAGGRRGRWN
jgi:magnesium chelatase subunit I